MSILDTPNLPLIRSEELNDHAYNNLKNIWKTKEYNKVGPLFLKSVQSNERNGWAQECEFPAQAHEQ